MNNDFNDWYDGAPVDFGTLRFSFDDWYDGAPVPLFVETNNLTAEAGSFALTGHNALFTVARSLAADLGAFSLTGYDASLTASGGAELDAETGEFIMVGSNAELSYSPYSPPVPPAPPIIGSGGGSTWTQRARHQPHRVAARRPYAEEPDVKAEPPQPGINSYLFARTGQIEMLGGDVNTTVLSDDEELAVVMLLIMEDDMGDPVVLQKHRNKMLTHHGA